MPSCGHPLFGGPPLQLGDAEADLRSSLGGIARGDPSAVFLRQGLGDIHPQSGMSRAGFPRRVSPVKGLEEVAQILFGKARTRVGDLHVQTLLIQEHAPANFAPGRGVPKGVGDHVVQDLRQAQSVHPHRSGTAAEILQAEMQSDALPLA